MYIRVTNIIIKINVLLEILFAIFFFFRKRKRETVTIIGER
jgi:hypothetical protein